MGDSLHLLEIYIRPCAFVKDVIQGTWRNLQEGVDRGGGRKLHGFKVVGENRIVVVLDGGIESALSSVNAAYGDHIEVNCTPVRSYETFADRVLGVERLLTKPSPRNIGTDGQLFWLHFKINYEGLNAAELVNIWAKEATTALTLRVRGDLELDLFKVVAQREVHAFFKAPDADIMDDIVFTLPLMKELGNQVTIKTKSICHMSYPSY